MKGSLADKIRLIPIQEAINEIESYLEGVNYSDFLKNSMIRFACIKQLEIIGDSVRLKVLSAFGSRLIKKSFGSKTQRWV